MNSIKKLLTNDVQEAIKSSKGNQDKFEEYLSSGSIIAFIREQRGCFELHGSKAGQLLVLRECIKTFAEENCVQTDAILDFIKRSIEFGNEPF